MRLAIETNLGNLWSPRRKGRPAAAGRVSKTKNYNLDLHILSGIGKPWGVECSNSKWHRQACKHKFALQNRVFLNLPSSNNLHFATNAFAQSGRWHRSAVLNSSCSIQSTTPNPKSTGHGLMVAPQRVRGTADYAAFTRLTALGNGALQAFRHMKWKPEHEKLKDFGHRYP